jgi:hypothetical protein
MNAPGVQESVADEVNTRLAKATQELQEKYASGRGGQETSQDGPTGKLYQEKRTKELQAKKLKKEQAKQNSIQNQNEDNAGQPDEEEFEEELEDDADNELEYLRQQRMRQLKLEHNEKLDNLSKGHGQYREISQDEFLKEMTTSGQVLCHFYHGDFPRCAIMDHHLYKLAVKHIECKFVKINAEKAPFFINKVRNYFFSVCFFLNEFFLLCLF